MILETDGALDTITPAISTIQQLRVSCRGKSDQSRHAHGESDRTGGSRSIVVELGTAKTFPWRTD